MSNFLADVDTLGIERAFDMADLRAAVRGRRFCYRSGVALTVPNAVLVIMTADLHRACQVVDAEVFDVLRPGYEMLARHTGSELKVIDGRAFRGDDSHA